MIIILVVVGVLFGGCCLMSTIAAIVIPNLIEARKAGNEAAAIGNLRVLCSAQAIHREQSTQQYADNLAELARAGMIDDQLGSGAKSGYLFEMLQGDQDTWSATATPKDGAQGNRAFFVDESGIIRYTPFGQTATADSPVLGQ